MLIVCSGVIVNRCNYCIKIYLCKLNGKEGKYSFQIVDNGYLCKIFIGEIGIRQDCRKTLRQLEDREAITDYKEEDIECIELLFIKV